MTHGQSSAGGFIKPSEMAGIACSTDAVLFVSKNGNDVDGTTWNKAFTTINAAISAASSDTDVMTLIVVTSGTYDLNVAGSVAVDKNIIIKSVSEFTVGITNTHASATGLFTASQELVLCHLYLDATNITAVTYDGATTGSRLDDIVIGAVGSTQAHTCIKFLNGSSGVFANNLKIVGNVSYTTGMDMGTGGSANTVWNNFEIFFCILGMHIQSGSTLHYFNNILCHTCTSAIQIDATASAVIIKYVAFVNCTTEITDNGTGTSIIREIDIDSITGIEGFTEILYVSPDGDDSDGKSWAGAINDLWEAMGMASSSSTAMTLIVCAPSTYDINQAGDPTVAKNLHIRGVGGDQGVGVQIENNHASATSVLKFTKKISIYNLGINLGTSNNGLIISGSDAIQGRLENVDIVMSGLTSQKVGVTYENCSFHSNYKVYFIGNTTHAIGLKFDNLQYYIDFDCLYLDCLIGITSTHADNDYMVFTNPFIHGCVTGVSLTGQGCDGFILDQPSFVHNITNFTAHADDHYHIMTPRFDYEFVFIYPTTASGSVEITGAGADTYGSWTEVIPVSTITKPFRIIGIGLGGTSDSNAVYLLQIGYGASNTIIATVPIQGGVKGTAVPDLNSGIIPENTAVSARIQTSNGGNDTLNLFIQYTEV